MVRHHPLLRDRSEAEVVELVRRGLAYVDGDTVVPVSRGGAPLTLLNDAEAQTSGTALATDGSNTGSATSNAFSAVVIGANMTATFDNAFKAHGSNGIKLALTSTATAATYVRWNFPAPVKRLCGAWYWAANRVPATSTIRHMHFLNGSTLMGMICGPESGVAQMEYRDNNAVTIGTTTGNVFSANTVYRIEFDVTFGQSSGSGTLNAYTGDSTTLLASAGFSGVPFGNGCDRCDQIRIGFASANYSSTTGDWLMLDSIYINDYGMPGPGPYPPVAVPVAADYSMFPKAAMAA